MLPFLSAFAIGLALFSQETGQDDKLHTNDENLDTEAMHKGEIDRNTIPHAQQVI